MELNPSEMTTIAAARVLDVSSRQVQRLAAAGELTEVGRSGGNLLLDANSVHRLADRGRRRGRPWSEETVWAAVDLLQSGHTARLNAAQRSRLRARLRDMDALEFVRLARRRSEVSHYRASSSFLERLREHVTLTGSAAVAEDRAVANLFGLATGNRATVDGYVVRHLVRDYEDEFFLAADLSGNVVLRGTEAAVTADDTVSGHRRASETVIALDLAESLDIRERSAGLRVLTEKLRQQRRPLDRCGRDNRR